MSKSPDATVGVEGEPSTLVRNGTTPEAEVVATQRANPEQYLAAINAVQHNTQRRVVWALVQNEGGVSYDELNALMDVSERTQRKHVGKLVDADLVERIEANFTSIEFASLNAEVLLKHALSVWYDATG